MRLVMLAPLALLACGCAPKLKPIFEERHPAIAWPPAPAPARIRYVGQLRSAADLKPPPKPFQRIARILVGAEKPRELYGPRSVVRSPDGERVWIADPGGRCLHLFDLSRRSYVKVDRAGESRLMSPVDVCLGPEASIFVCDSEFAAIHRLSVETGALLDSLPVPEDVHRPVAIAYDDETDELFVVDVIAHDIKVLGRNGRLRRIIGRRGGHPGEFNFPCDIAIDGDLLWVADAGNHRVQAITRAGEPASCFGQAGDALGDLALPKGVALDSDGHVYVVDARFENVQIFDRAGTLLLVFGQEGSGPGEFWLPATVFIDPDDRIWVCDSYNRRVQVFDYVRQPETREPEAAQPSEPSRPEDLPTAGVQP
jgi:DNA-binding beta-propeller fold protein YncE